MNLSSWPCSKLSVLLSSLISSDLPFSPYIWSKIDASVPAPGISEVQIQRDQGCSEEQEIRLTSKNYNLFLSHILSDTHFFASSGGATPFHTVPSRWARQPRPHPAI